MTKKGKWAKNWSKLRKKSVCCTPYLSSHRSYNFYLWYKCVYWYYLHEFLSFFFKKFHLLCLISQKLYIIWSSFVVHKCKMIICAGAFFIFSKFWFFGLFGESKDKKWQNDKSICLLHFISQELYIIWSWFMLHMCKRIIYPGAFYIFSKL